MLALPRPLGAEILQKAIHARRSGFCELQGTERRLLSLPVLTTPDAPTGKVLALDERAIIAAAGDVLVATSNDAFFTADSVALRVTMRLGAEIMRPERCAVLTIPTK